MKLVYSHPNFAQVGLVRSLLENDGIPTVTRNQNLSPLAGEVPVFEVWPELWVAEEDFERAHNLIEKSKAAPTPEEELSSWICPRCGAENEGNMGLCWNCDYAIDGPATQ